MRSVLTFFSRVEMIPYARNSRRDETVMQCSWCTVSHITMMSLRSKWAVGKAVRAGLAVGSGASCTILCCCRSGCLPPESKCAGQTSNDAAGPFINATLRAGGRLVVFPRSSLLTRINLDMLVARALKNSQLTCGDVVIICETVH